MSLVRIARSTPPRHDDTQHALGDEDVWQVLAEVMDPELGVAITELGLVYLVEVDGGDIRIDITTTTPICPLGSFISQNVKRRLSGQPNVNSVSVNIVHTPAWTPEMMSDAARELLGWNN